MKNIELELKYFINNVCYKPYNRNWVKLTNTKALLDELLRIAKMLDSGITPMYNGNKSAFEDSLTELGISECDDSEYFAEVDDSAEVSIENLIPSSLNNWLLYTTTSELKEIYNLLATLEFESEDAYVGELSDAIKDFVLTKLIKDLDKHKEFTLDDSEILSEIVDLLNKNNKSYKLNNNKITLL